MEHKPETRRMKLIRPAGRRETAEDRRLAPMMRALKAIHSATLPESMAPEDLEEASEVFPLPDGKYLIVEG